MSLTIIEQARRPIKTFENVEEFMKYYDKHKQRIDEQTTHALNKYYIINGYRLTRIKGNLKLKERKQSDSDEVLSIEERMTKLESVLNTLVDRFNSIIYSKSED